MAKRKPSKPKKKKAKKPVKKKAKKKSKPAAKRSSSSGSGGGRALGSLLSALRRAYRRRRFKSADPLDLLMLAVMAETAGERQAARQIAKIRERFVDWNEVRAARPRDLSWAMPNASPDTVRKTLTLLQSIYEVAGGLDLAPAAAMKPGDLRVWLGRLEGLTREDTDAVLMIAFGAPLMPTAEGTARVLRRLGLVPRKATRARAQRTALKGLAPENYREFYDLVCEHSTAVCRDQLPDCKKCKLRRICKSKGNW